MDIDWTDFWETRGNPSWRLWLWEIRRAYRKMLRGIKIKEPSILELGSGSGKNSLMMAKILGAKKVVLVDYNEKAERMDNSNNGFELTFLNKNVLDLNLKEKFDIVHSEGLIEHFYGNNRTEVFKRHVDFCKSGGLVLIFVPYKSIQYYLLKWANSSKWIEDKPFSRAELYGLCRRFGLDVIKKYTSPLNHEIGILARKAIV